MDDVMSGVLCFPLPEEARALYRGRRVVVTGGRGFLGSSLSQSLADLGSDLLLVDRSPAGKWMPSGGRTSHVQGDLRNPETWERVLPGADFVFHLASMEFARNEEYDPLVDIQGNFMPAVYLLECCRKKGLAPKILFASSANLAGDQDTLPVNESKCDNPQSLWSANKLVSEHYFRVYAAEHGIPSVCLRLANIYGPTPNPESMKVVVLNKVAAMAAETGRLVLFPNKHCVRDYLFIGDVVRAFLMAGKGASALSMGQYFYIGSGEALSIEQAWLQLAQAVEKRLGTPVSIDMVEQSLTCHAMREFVADTRAFEGVTGWTPLTRFRQGVELTLDALGVRFR